MPLANDVLGSEQLDRFNSDLAVGTSQGLLADGRSERLVSMGIEGTIEKL